MKYSKGLVIVLFAANCYSQVRSESSRQPINDWIAQLKSGPVVLLTVNKIADAHAVEAIPVLEQKFKAIPGQASERVSPNEELNEKSVLASALVRLGAKDKTYWEYLANQAKSVVESDVPYPMMFDSQGKSVRGKLSPEFLEWTRTHKVAPNEEANNQNIGVELRLRPLAMTGDSRGLTILRKGLSSHNFLVQYTSAQGLALLHDKPSIPLIIDACAKAPAEAASLVARALVFFDDPRASAASGRFILDERILEELRGKNREKGPRGVFDY